MLVGTKFILLTFFLSSTCIASFAQSNTTISIQTEHTSLVFSVRSNKKLYQTYFGQKLLNNSENSKLPLTNHEAFITSGTDNLFEPAIKIKHADGNPSLELHYQSHKVQAIDANQTGVSIYLKDPKYAVEVILHFTSYFKEDIIKSWTEIRHQEKKAIVISNFASSMLHFDSQKYWLTQFHGDHAREVNAVESSLTPGIKTLDSKLGARASKYQSPMFLLALDKPAEENSGELIAGTLAWTGNFQFLFEIDQLNSLRVISGINPYSSEYYLDPGKPFITPEFIFTYSDKGKGNASRNFHRWARSYGILDGDKPRYTLLNNWEATFFDFNQEKLVDMLDASAKLGVDVFLLDDGWFGNKYPRNNDKAGLGDWQENKKKMPDGIGYMVKEATNKGVKFGIWLEPEMVNPKSELYEKHPDWILKLPNRDENYQRNQLILDLTNPKVQKFIYDLVDGILNKNPGLAYIKWDCNRTMTNIYSPYLKDKQSHIYIDYTLGFYKILERLRQKYPHLPIMLCSGGGGRSDYGALKYFTEFWPSDNTGGLDRVYIQWGFSHFFPSLTLSSHVTSWGKQSLKFRTDVAMMGKLGYDIDLKHLSPEEIKFSSDAVKLYKSISNVIWFGDHYRLVSPYENNRAALMYVDTLKQRSILFVYNLNTKYNEVFTKVKLQGLDANKSYKIKEINLYPGTKSKVKEDETYSGDYLMKIGLNLSPGKTAALTSWVYEITETDKK